MGDKVNGGKGGARAGAGRPKAIWARRSYEVRMYPELVAAIDAARKEGEPHLSRAEWIEAAARHALTHPRATKAQSKAVRTGEPVPEAKS